jgi:hypothetical protein
MGCMVIGYGHIAKETKMKMRWKRKKFMHLMQSTSNKVCLSGMNLVPNLTMELIKEKIYFFAHAKHNYNGSI